MVSREGDRENFRQTTRLLHGIDFVARSRALPTFITGYQADACPHDLLIAATGGVSPAIHVETVSPAPKVRECDKSNEKY